MKQFTKFLYRALFVLSVIMLSFDSTIAQFPATLFLDSKDPSIVNSPNTVNGRSYTITVSGTYSMWPTNDSWGVDAAYLYNVPQEEIDAMRWPPQKFMNYIIYELPYWVGTDKEIPPITIPGLNYKFVSRQHMGFRYNGNWLPNSGFNSSLHTYQIKMMGDGNPIRFQILDSSFSITEMKVIEKYGDNSGSLKIVIEEEPSLNVCDLKLLCDGETIKGIKLSAAIFDYSDEFNGKPTNILNETSPEQLGIALDGFFICPDSIKCDNRVEGGLAWSLVFDRSGSMADPFGNTTKMDALKVSAKKFLQKFTSKDEGMLITFNEFVNEDVPWTSNISSISNVIDNLYPNGRTAYFDAALLGVRKTYPHNNPNKALILLSDGEDNESVSTEAELITEAKQKNIRIFTIGVNIFLETEASMKRIAAQTGGKYYPANDPAAMDAVFSSIERDVANSECCDIYFKIPQKVLDQKRPYKTKLTIMTFDKSGKIISKDVEITITDSCEVIQGIGDFGSVNNLGNLYVSPNPSNNSATIKYSLKFSGNAELTITNLVGQKLISKSLGYHTPGQYSYDINNQNLENGTYVASIHAAGTLISNKFIVIHK